MSGGNTNMDSCEMNKKDEAGKINDGLITTKEEVKLKETLTKEDLTKFQASINESFVKFEEGIKIEIMEMRKSIPILTDLIKKIEVLEENAEKNKVSLSNVHAELLVKEEEMKKYKMKLEKQDNDYKKKFEKMNNNIVENKKNTDAKIENYHVEYEKEIDKINRKINHLDNFIKNIPKVSVIESTTEDVIRRIENLEEKSLQKNNNFNTDNIKVQTNHQERNNIIADTDNLILGDSNTKHINTKILDKDSTTRQHTCYTFKEVIDYFKKVIIKIQPKNILIHCGCNDIDNYEEDALKIIGDIEEVIKIAREKFPESRIILSTLLPRKERKLDTVIAQLNDFIIQLPKRYLNISIMNNSMISKYELEDKKHLNRRGFYVFITNLKFTMFGILPNMHIRHNERNERSMKYSEQRYNGNRKYGNKH